MNDIVSIKKIRPLPSAVVGTGGAALTCGGDFFLAGNWPSLTVGEFLTAGSTEAHGGKHLFRGPFADMGEGLFPPRSPPLFLYFLGGMNIRCWTVVKCCRCLLSGKSVC